MRHSRFTWYHLTHLAIHQKTFYPDLVGRKIESEVDSYTEVYREFIQPSVLELERCWVQDQVTAPALYKASRRLKELTELLTANDSDYDHREWTVMLGAFSSVEGSGYALLKSLLLCTDAKVADLGAGMSVEDLVVALVQHGAKEIYIPLLSTLEIPILTELDFALRSRDISTQKLVVGGPVFDVSENAASVPNNITVAQYMSDILKPVGSFEEAIPV